MRFAAIIAGIFAAEFILAFVLGSFMRVGSNSDTRIPEDLDDGAA